MSTRKVTEAVSRLTNTQPPIDFVEIDNIGNEIAPLLPSRPPTQCAGCPHRASQYAMNSLGVQTKYNANKDFNTNLVGGLQRAGVNSVVSTAINGGSLENNLKQNLGEEALSVTTARLANEIGANKESLGEVGHKATHAALGCAGAKVQGKDYASGAVGAVAGEVIAEQVGQNRQRDKSSGDISNRDISTCRPFA